ncbi:MAG TPA: hypothetical protein DHW82_10400 [Spirochaetia bacterium]|nr:MAG: hypothetical protein A2Y41_00140 [Spirochaetes bacterium GWB1_36_13]HCL57402.1 hypothetical protein [Spirochaetia bacterium]
MKLSFIDLTPENWEVYKVFIMKSESTFPEEVQETEEDIYETLLKKGTAAKIALADGVYAGNTLAGKLNEEEIELYLLKDKGINPDASIYLYNIVVDEAYKNKGIGLKLLLETVEKAKAMGYQKMIGHFRESQSLGLFKRAGGQEIERVEDWFDSGESYVYCELDF